MAEGVNHVPSPVLGSVVTDASSCVMPKLGDNTSSGNDAHGGIH